MIIKKVLNNNAVIVTCDKGNEKVICGKGVGFNKQKGDVIKKNEGIKIFSLDVDKNLTNFEEIFKEIPIVYFEISQEATELLKKKNIKFKDSLKVTLADHLYGVVNRLNKNKVLEIKNMLLWDLKHFYEQEFNIAKDINQILKNKLNIKLNDDELGFVVLHLLNAQLNDQKKLDEILRIIKEIQQIIRHNLQVKFDENSYDYNRLVFHLKYFVLRLLKNTEENQKEKSNIKDESFSDFIKNEYSDAYTIATKVFFYLEKQYNFKVDNNEVIYLTIHIQRLITKSFK